MPADTLTVSEDEVGIEDALIDAMSEDSDAAAATLTEGDSDSTPAEGNDGADKATPPADGQPQEESDTGESEGDGADTKTAEKPAFDKEALIAKLGLSRNTPETIERLKDKLSASSTEAKRLVERDRKLGELLSAQGLKLHEDGENVGLIISDEAAQERATKISGLGREVFNGLSKDEQDKLIEEPAQFLSDFADKVVDTLGLRPNATMSERDVMLSDDAQERLLEGFWSEKNAEGNPVHKDRELFGEFMSLVLEDPTTPDDFIRWMGASDENFSWGQQLLYDKVNGVIGPELAAAEDAAQQAEQVALSKETSAKDDASLTSEGSGGFAPSGNKRKASDEQDDIVGAEDIF